MLVRRFVSLSVSQPVETQDQHCFLCHEIYFTALAAHNSLHKNILKSPFLGHCARSQCPIKTFWVVTHQLRDTGLASTETSEPGHCDHGTDSLKTFSRSVRLFENKIKNKDFCEEVALTNHPASSLPVQSVTCTLLKSHFRLGLHGTSAERVLE